MIKFKWALATAREGARKQPGEGASSRLDKLLDDFRRPEKCPPPKNPSGNAGHQLHKVCTRLARGIRAEPGGYLEGLSQTHTRTFSGQRLSAAQSAPAVGPPPPVPLFPSGTKAVCGHDVTPRGSPRTQPL